MEIKRKTTRKMAREKEVGRKKEKETEHEVEAEEKRKEERISFWQMSFDENNISKNRIKSSEESQVDDGQ